MTCIYDNTPPSSPPFSSPLRSPPPLSSQLQVIYSDVFHTFNARPGGTIVNPSDVQATSESLHRWDNACGVAGPAPELIHISRCGTESDKLTILWTRLLACLSAVRIYIDRSSMAHQPMSRRTLPPQ